MNDYFIENCPGCGREIHIQKVDAFMSRSEPTNLDLFSFALVCPCGLTVCSDGRTGVGIPATMKDEALKRHREWLERQKGLSDGQIDRLIALTAHEKKRQMM